jgi:hypothetical protein
VPLGHVAEAIDTTEVRIRVLASDVQGLNSESTSLSPCYTFQIQINIWAYTFSSIFSAEVLVSVMFITPSINKPINYAGASEL